MTANGKVDGPVSLVDKMNISEFGRFRAETSEEYEKLLKTKTIYDLCEEAARHGIRPDAGNRKRIERSLMEAYRKASRAKNASLAKAPPPISAEKKKKIEDLLSFIKV